MEDSESEAQTPIEQTAPDARRIIEGKSWTKPTEEPSMSLRPEGPPANVPDSGDVPADGAGVEAGPEGGEGSDSGGTDG